MWRVKGSEWLFDERAVFWVLLVCRMATFRVLTGRRDSAIFRGADRFTAEEVLSFGITACSFEVAGCSADLILGPLTCVDAETEVGDVGAIF